MRLNQNSSPAWTDGAWSAGNDPWTKRHEPWTNRQMIMAWAWMLWSPYALGTRTLTWFRHGCSADRMLSKHERATCRKTWDGNPCASTNKLFPP